MLPATGLFRSINCPFFEKDLCTRPFCHFRHLKPEAPPKATYSATPKNLLNQNNAGSESANQDGPVKKKPKLEYIPMPTILAAKYVPSAKAATPTTNNQNKIDEPEIDNKAEEAPPVDDQMTTVDVPTEDIVEQKNDVPTKELTNGQNGKEQNHDDDEGPVTAKENKVKPKDLEAPEVSDVEIKAGKRKDAEKSNSYHSTHRKVSQESDKHRKSSRDEKDHRKEKSHRKESDRKSSSSSTSERKHSSSSSSHRSDDKHRSRSDKEKERDKERSKSKHKDSSRDKERRPEKEKERTKSSDKDREKDRKKSSEKDRPRSSHSSSKSSSKSSSTGSKSSSSSSNSRNKTSQAASSSSSSSSSKPKVELADEIYRDLLDNPPSDIDIDSDEDEVMRQCRMIFEEYEDEPPAPAPTPPPVSKVARKKPDPKGGDVELIDMFAEKFYDENRKKRVAHESSSSNARPTANAAQPAPAKRTNYVQEAMRSVYHRQEIVRKQQEELAAKQRIEEENKKRIEEDTRKAMNKPVTPRLSNGSPRSPVLSPTPVTTPPTTDKSPVSPISTTSFYSKSPDSLVTTTPRSRFTPAVNVLAFQKAKEKIEQLRKMKAIGTPAQTAPKGRGRVAHTVSAPTVPAASTSAEVPATPQPPPPPAKSAPPVLEADSTKISFNIRMQFYNLMIKHCLNIYTDCDDAYDRAQTEELAVMKKCSTPMIYKSSALLTINKLRKEAVDSGSETTEKNKTISHDVILAGKMAQNISWSVNKKLKTEVKSAYTIDNAPSTVAYKMIYECILTEEQLQANGFPRPTDTPGKAKIYTAKPSRPPNEEERYCSRCSKVFNLETYEEPAVDSCNYHAKSTCYRRGFADNLHSCCQQPAGTAGCMYANYHVSSYVDYDDLIGFVKTIDPAEGYVPSKKDIFALDCEMCYTTGGLELTRVTVVDINEKTVYDSLVKPTNKVIDYNTRFSGITEQMLKNTTTTLHNVQAVLLSMFNSETILVGHSLESDFKALKLIHDVVVDTSVLYPHKMGPPKKRALKTLCIENLKKIIQENDSGHDSAEDSVVCIQLIKHYLRNRII
nr:RNA exonuclease 1 homolog [Aedes albopictus]